MPDVNIALLQSSFVIGNPLENARQLAEQIEQAIALNADIIITPECALSGYLPEDLLFRKDHQQAIEQALAWLVARAYPTTLLIGYPSVENHCLYNKMAVIKNGKILKTYSKQALPNYQVFDEKRYFSAGHDPLTINLADMTIGIFICEDLWDANIVASIAPGELDMIVSLNASPFHLDKNNERIQLLQAIAKEKHTAIAYVNAVGAQDSLIFDGGSLFMNANGEIATAAPFFKEAILINQYHTSNKHFVSVQNQSEKIESSEIILIEAICLAIKTYVQKNGFKQGVLIGLSGGIDSAVTLALAVKALGADAVQAIYMPSEYSADMSGFDADEQANKLGVKFDVLPINTITESFNNTLAPLFAGLPHDVTEENLQARSRGVLLMAVSNKLHKLVLTTGNKSEYAVGYATLYGDMCGGYAPLKDVYKTDVYRIAHALNHLGYYIPERVITREPSAELSPDQKDQDTLPPYDMLDRILELFIEQDLSPKAIQLTTGYAQDVIHKVVRMVIRNEYKRQQSALGPRLTKRAFDKDRRYPISADLNDLLFKQSES